MAVPGYDVRILDDAGREVASGETASIAIKLPLPPGCLLTLWNNDESYRESYLDRFPGYYLTADAGYKDEDGYLWVMSRTDDIINVAGHRLSTGAMEEVLASHPNVAESAVVGVADEEGVVLAGGAAARPVLDVVRLDEHLQAATGEAATAVAHEQRAQQRR